MLDTVDVHPRMSWASRMYVSLGPRINRGAGSELLPAHYIMLPCWGRSNQQSLWSAMYKKNSASASDSRPSCFTDGPWLSMAI